MAPTIAAIYVYPVKACQGVQVPLFATLPPSPRTPLSPFPLAQPSQLAAHNARCSRPQVQSAELGSHGFALDRIFCVVDRDGTRHPKCEALSQRKLPALGAVSTALSADGKTLTLSTPDGRAPLVLQTDAASYSTEGSVTVECGGKDTITGAGWFLGKVSCRSAGDAASAWLSAYLNAAERADPFADEPCALPLARYCLVRSDAAAERDMADFVGAAAPRDPASVELRGFDMPEIPVLQSGAGAKDAVRFQDFAPFLVTTEASLASMNDVIRASPASKKASLH